MRVGLVNLGNTCYLNSSIQILNRVNEFKACLVNTKINRNASINTKLASSLRDILVRLDNAGEAVNPEDFLSIFFAAFPQFAEKDQDSHGFQQQDADECFQLLLNELEPVYQSNGRSVLADLFEVNFKVTFFNKDTNEIEGDPVYEKTKKLTCIIDNQSNPVNNLSDGIKAALEESITKRSMNLNVDADFLKRYRMSNLPVYLLVQKIRFVWREKDINTNTEARKAKILRNVSFPKILDVYEFCDEGIQKELAPTRADEVNFLEEEKKENQVAYDKFKQEQGLVEEDNYKIYRRFQEEQKKKDDEKHDERLWAPVSTGKPTGQYQLVGVVTHKGRSSDSGHYVSWVQQKGDAWLKFDDDIVSNVKIEDILNLRGGGDWHMAYYLVYRRLEFKR